MTPSRPSVSRDTRVLFVIVVVSMVTLWVLARFRFPDRVPAVAPVLAQLAPMSAFDDIATIVAQVAGRVGPSIVAVGAGPRGAETGSRSTVSALRFRDDLAVLLLDGTGLLREPVAGALDVLEIARDRASRLAVVRLPAADTPVLSTWAPRRLSTPRFLIAARATPTGLSVRPLFVASLRAVVTPIWLDPIWELPDGTDLARGTFMFNVDGALAGLVIEHGGRPAIVPADTVVARAERLARESQSRPGVLGVEIGPLTPLMAAATGATSGVVVTWVDPQGPAAQYLRIADVVESVDGNPTTTIEHWIARVARLSEGESVGLRIRRTSESHDVRLMTIALGAAVAAGRPLGLTLQTIRGTGAAVVRVDPGSEAAQAGLEAGDVITLVGEIKAPNAAQASRVFSTSPVDRPVVVAFERGHAHHLIALRRTW